MIRGPQACGGASAVAFQAELVLQRPDDRLDALAQPVREVSGGLLVLAGWADQGQVQIRAGEERFGVFAGQALIGDDGGTGCGAVAGWSLSIVRAWSRSPASFGLARANPVTDPSQVQITSSVPPQYQRE
jgi:hypothetical protein